ncbi:BCCT family transporter [uncultured Clostridium sp.]|uniref:BCCT family transporter n=1 Tax=uncultured Clostridium sp. TaxID=59620 RepID=UPI00261850E8|nr:BCCT family transporter [uncultured Clostridium sp.]
MNLKEKYKKSSTYYLTIAISILILIWGVFFTESFKSFFDAGFTLITEELSPYFMILMLVFTGVCGYLYFSKYKNIKLGADDSKPEFSKLTWFAMLFGAGLGIGLVFYGVSEPLAHYLNPVGVEAQTTDAIKFAFSKSFLHNGITAWTVYASLALIVGYFHFRKGKKILLSAMLEPVIGEKHSKGLVGKVIDILTIFVTIVGIVTSLGMGTLQINSGLNYLFGVPENGIVRIIIISIVTVLFLISATTGVKKGIKILSNLNLGLAVALFIGVLAIVSKSDLIQNAMLGFMGYGKAMIVDNLNIFANGEWYSNWTIFFWAWWIAWAPFVAIFIARVSKGRTIKEFITGVVLVPATACILWFLVFGTLAISASPEIQVVAGAAIETSLFVVLSEYGTIGFILSIVALCLLFTFFITSADSATYVLAVIASDGDLDAKNSRKIVIGVLQALLTIAFLAAGGIYMVQTATVVMALPFSLVILGIIRSFFKVIKTEQFEKEVKVKNAKTYSHVEEIYEKYGLIFPKEIKTVIIDKEKSTRVS